MNLKQFSFRAVGIALLATSLAQPTQAAIVNLGFSVTPDSGPLTGNTYTGFVGYDDALVPPSFTGTVDVADFFFILEGLEYTEADDTGAQVSFVAGNFLGFNFSVSDTPSFSFLSGSNSLDEALFFYDVVVGSAPTDGSGTVRFAIPEPPSLLGLLGLGLLGLTRKPRKS